MDTQLTLVRGALAPAADGSFGECVHCGKTIGAKRLEALPWTPYCIDCQEQVENGEIGDPVQAAVNRGAEFISSTGNGTNARRFLPARPELSRVWSPE